MSISFWFSGNILLHAAFWVVSLEWEYRQGDKSETELHIFLRST